METMLVVGNEEDLHLTWNVDAMQGHSPMRIGSHPFDEIVRLGPVTEYHPDETVGRVWEAWIRGNHDQPMVPKPDGRVKVPLDIPSIGADPR